MYFFVKRPNYKFPNSLSRVSQRETLQENQRVETWQTLAFTCTKIIGGPEFNFIAQSLWCILIDSISFAQNFYLIFRLNFIVFLFRPVLSELLRLLDWLTFFSGHSFWPFFLAIRRSSSFALCYNSFRLYNVLFKILIPILYSRSSRFTLLYNLIQNELESQKRTSAHRVQSIRPGGRRPEAEAAEAAEAAESNVAMQTKLWTP